MICFFHFHFPLFRYSCPSFAISSVCVKSPQPPFVIPLGHFSPQIISNPQWLEQSRLQIFIHQAFPVRSVMIAEAHRIQTVVLEFCAWFSRYRCIQITFSQSFPDTIPDSLNVTPLVIVIRFSTVTSGRNIFAQSTSFIMKIL